MVLSTWAVAAAALLHASALVSAHPAPSLAHSEILTRSDDVRDQYDYVIVGGGTAGLTVADRLTENGKCTNPLC
jgi:NADPH-dependent 2,4-dienoyl-CoA reductase/sulfur reductase-like enzyme